MTQLHKHEVPNYYFQCSEEGQRDRFYLRNGTQNTQYAQCVVNISELDKWFFLRNENSIYAMVILFTQWKFYLRNGSFTVQESKNSFYAMAKLQILTTFFLRNKSRSYAYDEIKAQLVLHLNHIMPFWWLWLLSS